MTTDGMGRNCRHVTDDVYAQGARRHGVPAPEPSTLLERRTGCGNGRLELRMTTEFTMELTIRQFDGVQKLETITSVRCSPRAETVVGQFAATD